MSVEIWLAYVAAILVMMSTPGPSHLLMLSNSMTNGFRRSLATAGGDLTANMLQMLAAGVGLGVLIRSSENTLLAIKWAGVLYLLIMGIGKIRKARADGVVEAPRTSLRTLWLQGFVTSAANPKAVVFFAALFPQFIQPQSSFQGSFSVQFVILSVTYLVIDGVFLGIYGGGASWLARRLSGAVQVGLGRANGVFLILAAVLLGLKTASR